MGGILWNSWGDLMASRLSLRLSTWIVGFLLATASVLFASGIAAAATQGHSAPVTHGYGTPVHVYDAAAHSAQAHTSDDQPLKAGGVLDGVEVTGLGVSGPLSVALLKSVAANTAAVAKPWEFTPTETLSGSADTRIVNQLADSMRANGWQGDPIRVVEINGERIVVDGHHRIAAARVAGIDVPYEVVDPASVIGPGQWSSLDDLLNDAATAGGGR